MTEGEWLECTDPAPMLESLRGKASDRKLRLFACACCRRVWDLLPEMIIRQLVDVAERYVDGKATVTELGRLRKLATRAEARYFQPHWLAVRHASVESAHWIAYGASLRVPCKPVLGIGSEGAAQAILLRDIFGNPFRPVALDPAWLAWNGGTVRKMAEAIYDDRAFDRLPILADALEEAGCTDRDILDHCRSGGDHVRGCWVIDLLLGKE